MLVYIGKIENSMLKAADFVKYAESIGIHCEIVTQGESIYICLGKSCLDRLKFVA